MAGVVYNILHDIPFTTTDRNGNTIWISDQNRMQLGAEGFIMSLSISFVGLLIIGWHKLIKVNQNLTVIKMIYIGLFVLTVIMVIAIESIYKTKGWYGPKFFPPAHYNKGPLMIDQGNNI